MSGEAVKPSVDKAWLRELLTITEPRLITLAEARAHGMVSLNSLRTCFNRERREIPELKIATRMVPDGCLLVPGVTVMRRGQTSQRVRVVWRKAEGGIGASHAIPLANTGRGRPRYARIDLAAWKEIPLLREVLWAPSLSHHDGRRVYYATSAEGLKMHRLICEHFHGPRPGPEWSVDHIDRRRTLDNRTSNLRWATPSMQGINTGMRRDNTSGFRGVTLVPSTGRWVGRVRFEKVEYRTGSHAEPVDAHHALNEIRLSLGLPAVPPP